MTMCNFTLDNEAPESFRHTPESTTDLFYGYNVFSKSNLTNGSHVLNINPTRESTNTYLNFDYALYTYVQS
jgi:hypothetical protein